LSLAAEVAVVIFAMALLGLAGLALADHPLVSPAALVAGWQALAIGALVLAVPLRTGWEFRRQQLLAQAWARTRQGMPQGSERSQFEQRASQRLRWLRWHFCSGAVLTPARWAGVLVMSALLQAGNLTDAIVAAKLTVVLLGVECLVREGVWRAATRGKVAFNDTFSRVTRGQEWIR